MDVKRTGSWQRGGQASRDLHLPTITLASNKFTHVIQLIRDTCDVIRNHGCGIQPLPISRLSRCCILCCRQRRNIPPKSLVISIVPETSMNRADPMPKSDPGRPFSHPYANFLHLVTGTAGLGDDALELVDLRLGAAESSELGEGVSDVCRGGWRRRGVKHTLFLASLRARLSLLLRRSSMTRRS